MRRWQVLILVVSGLLVLGRPATPALAQAEASGVVHIFFSRGCADCWPYVEKTLVPALRAGGVTAEPVIHDFTRPGGRQLLADQAAAVGLPRRIADSLYAFVTRPDSGSLVVLGHVPRPLLDELLARDHLPRKLVIQQPKMHGTPEEYRLWSFAGEVLSFPIDTPLTEALPLLPPTPSQTLLAPGDANPATLLPAVVVTGLLDSINPCAFAVILLLLAFLFTIRKSRGQILGLGAIYVAVIFAVYFAIGVGILSAVRISEDPHFVARVGSYLLIGLGVLNLIEYRWPQFPLKLHMPAAAHEKVNKLLKVATVPATIGIGFIVGLCTFPCSGGIYVSIITLLNAKTTLAWGLAYLTLYNLLYIFPLVVILLAAGNRLTAKKWAAWEREHALSLRLWFGLIMIGLGAVMLWMVIPAGSA
ncbi:MAG: cytochrome c biogenesis CcdA family protein [Candidatus Methylomirabilales bacterium]